jgi:hypothetical protein
MTESIPVPSRGRPPNRDQLAEHLGDRLAFWNAIRETVVDIGATWKWVYSDATGTWSHRSYLSGDRFFASLSLVEGGFEISLNLKADEWPAVTPETPAEQALFERLMTAATSTGQDPAWVHVPVSDPSALSLITKLLVIRARRVQPPRLKKSKKR